MAFPSLTPWGAPHLSLCELPSSTPFSSISYGADTPLRLESKKGPEEKLAIFKLSMLIIRVVFDEDGIR